MLHIWLTVLESFRAASLQRKHNRLTCSRTKRRAREENRRIWTNNRAKTEKNAPALGDLVYGSHVSLLEKGSHEKNHFSASLPLNPAGSHVRLASEQHEYPLTGTSKSSASDMVGVLVVKIGKVQLDVVRQSPARRRETESGRRRSAHAPEVAD